MSHSPPTQLHPQAELPLLFRFTSYGVFGMAGELFWYTLARVCRQLPLLRWLFSFEWRVDPRLGLEHVWHVPLRTLYGQCSLWMFPVYALCMIGIVEPFYRRFAHWSAL